MKFTSLENLQYFLSKLSYVSKESGLLNSIITSYLNDFKRDVVKIVSSLPSEGETGVLYLVSQGNNQFIEYYYNSNNNSYIQLGSSVFDVSVDSQLSNVSNNTLQNKVISNALDLKLDSSQLVNALNNTSSETPQSQVLYDAFGNKIDSNDFLKISNSDISSLFLLLPNGSEIFCSNLTTWYLTENGDLYGCGSNSSGSTHGQLSLGNEEGSIIFVKIASGVKNLKCTSETAWYLSENGDLYGCGGNSGGQQGSGDTSNVLTFTKRAENVKDFECTEGTTWYINNNNELYGCGQNYSGQQGSGDTSNVLTFTKRAENVKAVDSNPSTTWFIDFEGNLYGCGSNRYGQQGSGDTSNVLTFTKRAENVKDFSCSSETSWYVNDNNELYGCGHNNHGQQSSNNTTDILRFTLRRSGVRKVVAENESTWCIKTDDTLYSCGDNSYGWLGKAVNGDSKNFDVRAVGSNVKDIFINLYTARYLTNNNELYSCGYNAEGQQSLSYGETHSNSVDFFRKRAENVKKVATSTHTIFYIDFEGNLYGCGDNRAGQQGNNQRSGNASNGFRVETFTKINI